MPRAETSQAGRILAFFDKTPLETADLVLGLCADKVRERKSKSQAAKQRSQEAAGTAGPAKTKTAKKKKKPGPKPATDAPQVQAPAAGTEVDQQAAAE